MYLNRMSMKENKFGINGHQIMKISQNTLKIFLPYSEFNPFLNIIFWWSKNLGILDPLQYSQRTLCVTCLMFWFEVWKNSYILSQKNQKQQIICSMWILFHPRTQNRRKLRFRIEATWKHGYFLVKKYFKNVLGSYYNTFF